MNRIGFFAIAMLTVVCAAGQAFIGNRVGLGFYHQVLKADKELPDNVTEDQTTLMAPTITMPIEARLSEHFSLVIEPGFAQRGSRYENSSTTTTERVNSVELALLAKGAMTFGRFEPYVIAGPSFTRPITVRIALEHTGGTTPYSDEATGNTDDVSSYEPGYFCAFAGIGLAWKIGAAKLFIDYRAMWGLTPVQSGKYTDINGNVLGDLNVFDRGHILSIGWSIPLSREVWRATSAPTAEPGTSE